MKKKRNLKIGALIIIALLIGYFLGTNSMLKAQTEDNIERAISSKHGYGIYLNFEYEIIQNYPYGTFVVVKDNNKNQLTVAGL